MCVNNLSMKVLCLGVETHIVMPRDVSEIAVYNFYSTHVLQYHVKVANFRQ